MLDPTPGNGQSREGRAKNGEICLANENFSIKHDLARSCFQLWPKISDEGDKTEKTVSASAWPVFFLEILSPSELMLRAIIENIISPDYVLWYFGKIWKILDFLGSYFGKF